MFSAEKIRSMMAWSLIIGTLLSAILVIIGGGMYLYEMGNNEMLFTFSPITLSFYSPLGLIQAGLLLLVAVQTIRVALLCWFYTAIRDYKFSLISAFILMILIYSSFWPN